MTKDEFRRVEAWLYSVTRIRIALETLQLELERLDTKAASPPQWMSQISGMPFGGGELDSRQSKWVEFMDGYQIKRNEILEAIRIREHHLECFEKVMQMLRDESSQYVQLVNNKYIDKVKPDSYIFEKVLFVGHSKFYEMRRYVVQAFFECLPAEFQKRIKCG